MDYFPIFLNLKNKRALVVGGGEVACRKIDLLLKTQANISLVSPTLHPYLQPLVQKEALTYKQKNYESSDLKAIDLVFVATDCKQLNQQVHQDAEQKHIWVNVVDDTKLCDFITPSIVNRNPIQVAISSNGKAPVLIRYLREKLETFLPQNLSLLADFAGDKRDEIKEKFDSVGNRRKFWEAFFTLPMVENANSKAELSRAFELQLSQAVCEINAITLVQIGTDPELLTLKALRLMQQAEVVFFDAKIPAIFVELCRRDAQKEMYENQETLLAKLSEIVGKTRVCILVNNIQEIALIEQSLPLGIYCLKV